MKRNLPSKSAQRSSRSPSKGSQKSPPKSPPQSPSKSLQKSAAQSPARRSGTAAAKPLEHLATLWSTLLGDRLEHDEAARCFGAVRLTLEPEGATLGVQLERGKARTCATSALRGPTLLALEGTLAGQRAFFDGRFAAALERGDVRVEAAPALLQLMGVQ